MQSLYFCILLIFMMCSLFSCTQPKEKRNMQSQESAQDSDLRKIEQFVLSEEKSKFISDQGEVMLSASMSRHLSHEMFGSSTWTKSGEFMDRQFVALAMPATELILDAFQITPDRLEEKVKLPDHRYSVNVIVPKGSEDMLRPLVKHVIMAGLGVSLKKELREKEIGILQREAPLKLRRSVSKQSFQTVRLADGIAVIEGTRITTKALAESFADSPLRLPVFDNTAIEGKYDFNIAWKHGDINSLHNALKEIGLRLVIEKQPIEMLIVESSAGSGK